MTEYYQPLDLTTKTWANDYLKNRFSTWYADEIRKSRTAGVELEDIHIKFLISKMKPLQAGWIVDLYNELTSPAGRKVLKAGWVRSGIADAWEMGSRDLPFLDPFQDLDPL